MLFSGYQILLIIAISLFIGLGSGWKITSWHDQAVQLASVEAAIAQTKKEQLAINKDETKSLIGKNAETAKTLQLTGELKHDKKLIDIKLDSTTKRILHSASMPATKLP